MEHESSILSRKTGEVMGHLLNQGYGISFDTVHGTPVVMGLGKDKCLFFVIKTTGYYKVVFRGNGETVADTFNELRKKKKRDVMSIFNLLSKQYRRIDCQHVDSYNSGRRANG